MLFGISFTARPGAEAELERLLSEPELTRRAAERMGARTDALLVQGNRFTRIYEFEDAGPVAVRQRVLAAQQAPEFQDMLRRAAQLVSDPFDPDDPTSVAAFVQRHKMRLVVEAHAPAAEPPRGAPGAAADAPKASSGRPPIGAAPR